jgi:hypothetical protein
MQKIDASMYLTLLFALRKSEMKFCNPRACDAIVMFYNEMIRRSEMMPMLNKAVFPSFMPCCTMCLV